MNTTFWSGKRVFVTGHTGFKGGWLSLWLTQMGASVTGYSLAPNTEPNFYTLVGVGDDVTSHIEDVCDANRLRAAVSECQPDIVFHLAAQPLVRASYHEPLTTFATNVMGTANVLQACRGVPTVKAAVIITTDKCYDNQEWHWGYRESDPLGGNDPYSASKACAELVTHAFRQAYFADAASPMHIASARAGNVIGGGDWSTDRLLPDIVREFAKGEPVIIRNPDAVRPWQHVLEPLAGYLNLAERLCAPDGANYAESWNFGPSDAGCQSVQWIVQQMAALWGEGANWAIDNTAQPHEATLLKLDCAKAQTRLKWHAKWSLEHTLASIVAWHKALQQGNDMRAIALQTLAQYEQDATVDTR